MEFALITGSSRGIGRGIALKLAERGAKIGVHYYRNEAAAKDTLEEVRRRGADGFIVQADTCRTGEIGRIFAETKKHFGKLDVFVHNARPEASEFFQPPMDITLAQWDAAFDSQAKAFLVAVREAAALMSRGGRIFAMVYAQGSRTGGLLPWVGMGSAKAAVESLVRYFAVALAPRGITSVLNSRPDGVQDLIRNWHTRGWTPMGRLGTPEDIGNVVSMFCSPESDWITGQVIYADGGASLMSPEVPPEIQIG